MAAMALYLQNIIKKRVHMSVNGVRKIKSQESSRKKLKKKLEGHIIHTCNVSILSLVMPAFSLKPYTSGEVCIGRFWMKRMTSW
jgi:hypothetical protein